MKQKRLGVSVNLFPLSRSKTLKDNYHSSKKITSSQEILPLQMGLMQIKRFQRKNTESRSKRKKTNRIFKLYKRDKNLKSLGIIKKELEIKILGKYANPYMKNITHMISPFTKEKKILYYDYYRICISCKKRNVIYILDIKILK